MVAFVKERLQKFAIFSLPPDVVDQGFRPPLDAHALLPPPPDAPVLQALAVAEAQADVVPFLLGPEA